MAITVHQEKFFVETSDRWRIAVFHYAPPQLKHKLPVLLLHGIASNHYTYDPGEDQYSLARYLQGEGWDVYAIDLRGRGASDGPHTGRGDRWSIDDYLVCDLPRVVDEILTRTGTTQLHWVGHSMGGFLGYFYQIRHHAHQIRSLTTIATSLTYTFSTINLARNWLDYLTFLPYFPFDRWWKFLTWTANWDVCWNRFFANTDNLTPGLRRVMFEKIASPISVPEWNQSKMISTSEGMARISSGSHYHTIKDRRLAVPTLALAGADDWICPLEGVEWTVDNLECETRLIVFGKKYGYKVDYGHMDMVYGIEAPNEVWPRITSWLEEKDAQEEDL